MELLLAIAILLAALAVDFPSLAEGLRVSPRERWFAVSLGRVVLPLPFVALLAYGQADPTAFA
jgi:hypothetical protein